MVIDGLLQELHSDIDECWRCKSFIPDLVKPIGLKRGNAGSVMIVGQNPGKVEHRAGAAFAGQSGIRLNDWLRRSGADPANPRLNVYCTSVAKCVAPSDASLPKMILNCRPFLERQIRLIRPRLIITLGTAAFSALDVVPMPFTSAICRLFDSREMFLINPFGFDFSYLPWPHPSGLSRWHNLSSNRAMLEASFQHIRSFIINP